LDIPVLKTGDVAACRLSRQQH